MVNAARHILESQHLQEAYPESSILSKIVQHWCASWQNPVHWHPPHSNATAEQNFSMSEMCIQRSAKQDWLSWSVRCSRNSVPNEHHSANSTHMSGHLTSHFQAMMWITKRNISISVKSAFLSHFFLMSPINLSGCVIIGVDLYEGHGFTAILQNFAELGICCGVICLVWNCTIFRSFPEKWTDFQQLRVTSACAQVL